MDDTLFTIIKYVLSILSLVVFRYLIPYVGLKLKDNKYEGLVKFVEKAINAAESIYKALSNGGEVKKAYVIDKIKEYVTKNNIKITDDQINLLIEAIFNELDGLTVNK